MKSCRLFGRITFIRGFPCGFWGMASKRFFIWQVMPGILQRRHWFGLELGELFCPSCLFTKKKRWKTRLMRMKRLLQIFFGTAFFFSILGLTNCGSRGKVSLNNNIGKHAERHGRKATGSNLSGMTAGCEYIVYENNVSAPLVPFFLERRRVCLENY